jgi:hypothetical protein
MNRFCLFGLVLALSWAGVSTVAAGLEFAEPKVALKASHLDTETPVNFTFKATGEAPTKILDIQTYCACLKASPTGGKMEFAPGETGTIECAFLLGTFEGEVTKNVVLTTDNPAQKEITLAVTITIPKIYEVTPDQVTWTIGEACTPKTVRLKILDEKPIRLTGATSSREKVSATFKAITEGKEYEVTLTPETTAEPMLGTLRLDTDAPYPRYQKKLVFFNVLRPRAAVAPSKP